MQIDVSDIFDHLYDVAQFARPRFELSQSQEGEFGEWDNFCSNLSDSLFLPAVTNRAFQITHASMLVAEAKERIITERRTRDGGRIFYCRYNRPIFHVSPAFCADQIIDGHSSLRYFYRPYYSLKLWLGRLPATQIDFDAPPYPKDLDSPIRYFTHSYSTDKSKSRLADYYEIHENWCLRRIQQDGPRFIRSQPNGVWIEKHDFQEIHKDWFDVMWTGSEGIGPDLG